MWLLDNCSAANRSVTGCLDFSGQAVGQVESVTQGVELGPPPGRGGGPIIERWISGTSIRRAGRIRAKRARGSNGDEDGRNSPRGASRLCNPS